MIVRALKTERKVLDGAGAVFATGREFTRDSLIGNPTALSR